MEGGGKKERKSVTSSFPRPGRLGARGELGRRGGKEGGKPRGVHFLGCAFCFARSARKEFIINFWSPFLRRWQESGSGNPTIKCHRRGGEEGGRRRGRGSREDLIVERGGDPKGRVGSAAVAAEAAVAPASPCQRRETRETGAYHKARGEPFGRPRDRGMGLAIYNPRLLCSGVWQAGSRSPVLSFCHRGVPFATFRCQMD